MQPAPVPRFASPSYSTEVCTIPTLTSLNLPPLSSDLSSALQSWSTSLAKQCESHWSSHCGHSRIGWCTSTEAVPTSLRPALASFTSGVETWWSSHKRDWASVCPEAASKLPTTEGQQLSLAMGFVDCSDGMLIEAGASTRNDQPISTLTSIGTRPTTTVSDRSPSPSPASTTGTTNPTQVSGNGAGRDLRLSKVGLLSISFIYLFASSLQVILAV